MKDAKEILSPEEIKTMEVYIFTKEEREFMRKNILVAIAQVPSQEVLAQFEEVVFYMSIIDLPGIWKSCIKEIT